MMSATYKNGREAKQHDEIVGRDVAGRAVAGVLIKLSEATGSGEVQPDAERSHVSLKDCLHIDDVFPVEQVSGLRAGAALAGERSHEA